MRLPSGSSRTAASRQFDAIDFDALHALARREAHSLLGHQSRHTRSPERARMNIDVGAARFWHHEAKAFLLVEELHVAVAHRTARFARPARWSRPARHGLRLGGGQIDAVDVRHLHAALAVRHFAKHGCTLWKLRGRKIRQRRRVTKSV